MCATAPNETRNVKSSEHILDKVKSINQGHQGWGTRHTFVVLGFLGFVLCYALRFNLSIAIVKMVHPRSEADSSSSAKFNKTNTVPQSSGSQQICPRKLDNFALSNFTGNMHNSLTNQSFPHVYNSMSERQFDWTEEQQGTLLGGFFWGYVLTQYPGGKLSHVYGPKWVFSCGILITGVLSLIIPVVTVTFDVVGLVIVRFLQGLAEGVTLPSILVMLSHWSPVEERGRMTNWLLAGIPIGTAVIMIAGGYLINLFGWPSVFYCTGIATLIWFVFWGLMVFDTPSKHPRITNEELKYIQSNLTGLTTQENIPTPWKSILSSLPVWAIFIADFGDSWSHYLLHVEIPIYLSSVHGFDIETNGWFSALPQLMNCTLGICVAFLTDFIISRKYLTVITTRRVCSTMALWGASAGFIGMICGGCNTIVAVVSLNFAAAISGTSNSGWVVNHIEIVPNHAGTISGVANSVGNILGFVAPYVTGLILQNNSTLLGWQMALAIPAILSFSVSLFYLAFSSSEEQPWNKPKEEASLESSNMA